MAITLIKNKHGRVVSTSPERKKYLLANIVYALKKNGQPKEDANGEPIKMVKSQDEIGWTDVTPAEQKRFEEELEQSQIDAEEVEDAQRAAKLATATASKLAADAGKKDQKNSKAQAAAEKKLKDEADAKSELEADVRDAEGNAKKYDALTDDGKALYLELFGGAPEGAK